MNLKLPLLALAGLFALSSHAADPAQGQPAKADAKASPPFSEAIEAGGTLYVAGHIGFDAATKKVPADPEAEVRAVMDAVKHTVEGAGYQMDDLVSVTVYCSDLDLFDKFNGIYRGYFHGKYPTRAFIGVYKLLAGARFEVSGIAAKGPTAHKL